MRQRELGRTSSTSNGTEGTGTEGSAAEGGRERPPGRLFVVATPLGNLQDITLRALRVLGEADLIAAEDTRRTRSLLSAHGIRGRTVSYHEHNERRRSQELLSRLRQGLSVALVSDAGSPLVCDPGFHLIRAAIREGIAVEAVPGPCSPVAALQVAGFTSDTFVFHGFLPKTRPKRARVLQVVGRDPRTQVLFETPHRVSSTLEAMDAILGERPVVLCRELTKLHEEALRGTAREILEELRRRPRKGEMILVVSPLSKRERRGRSAE